MLLQGSQTRTPSKLKLVHDNRIDEAVLEDVYNAFISIASHRTTLGNQLPPINGLRTIQLMASLVDDNY